MLNMKIKIVYFAIKINADSNVEMVKNGTIFSDCV